MSSIALPPLPSARAKAIENKIQQSVTLQTALETHGGDAQKTSPVVSTANVKATTEPTHNSTHSNNEPSETNKDVTSQQIRERTKYLQSLHRKEQQAFGTLPPLDSNLPCEAMHEYIATTSAFLNSYVADVNAALEGTSHKLSVLEKQMSLLEGRLASIPGLIEEEKSGDLGAVQEADEGDELTSQ
ncbi:hypothetical protein HJC23_009389 [Cyclotella cryptica]|uniref:Uncharacterized protein n=1 Tax=Cyclotella cryptica TaxID=29204 RepID=A0ABD3PZ66_9STRA|eukprot:CCRYP_010574-RA/>CCRYP_010574-RA protein AED:0.00 eAED:0.00 QI:332/-1/1/1/-1/1/1/134/185